MATDVWAVLDEEQRLPWLFAPFERVGPLEFGMTHEQAEAAVDGILRTALSEVSSGNEVRGPQVTLDGMGLVGQVPSRLEDQFTDYLKARDKDLRYSQCADPCSAQLGLVLWAQRAGDLVSSRPVMVAEAWAVISAAYVNP